MGSAKLQKNQDFFMGFTVLHSEKGKGSAGGIGNHIDRTEGHEHNYSHIDKTQESPNLNFHLPDEKHSMSLQDAINFRIKQGYNGERKIRTDAVTFNTHILSGSHEDMKEIFKDKEKSNAWIKDNYEFIKKEFGEKNIVRFSLHLDEKTPHIHAVTVPLTPDGRLSSKEVLGNPKTLRERHDTYAQAMKPYGLERGKRDTGISHEDAKAYYSRMKEAIEPEKDLTVHNKFLGVELNVNKDKTIEKLKSALESQRSFSNSLKTENEKLKLEHKAIKQKADEYSKNFMSAISSEKTFQQYHEMRIDRFKKEINYDVGKSIRYGKGLHKMDAGEKRDFLNEKIKESARKNNIPTDTTRKIYEDKNFLKGFMSDFEKEAERQKERSQNRGRNEGHSY